MGGRARAILALVRAVETSTVLERGERVSESNLGRERTSGTYDTFVASEAPVSIHFEEGAS